MRPNRPPLSLEQRQQRDSALGTSSYRTGYDPRGPNRSNTHSLEQRQQRDGALGTSRHDPHGPSRSSASYADDRARQQMMYAPPSTQASVYHNQRGGQNNADHPFFAPRQPPQQQQPTISYPGPGRVVITQKETRTREIVMDHTGRSSALENRRDYGSVSRHSISSVATPLLRDHPSPRSHNNKRDPFRQLQIQDQPSYNRSPSPAMSGVSEFSTQQRNASPPRRRVVQPDDSDMDDAPQRDMAPPRRRGRAMPPDDSDMEDGSDQDDQGDLNGDDRSQTSQRANQSRASVRSAGSGGRVKKRSAIVDSRRSRGFHRGYKKRYRNGDRALMEIRKYQKSCDLLVQKTPFYRLVREVAAVIGGTTNNFRFQASALQALQAAAEAHLVKTFEDAHLLTAHRKRVTLIPADIQLVRRLHTP